MNKDIFKIMKKEKTSRSKFSKRGFTLIEALVALFCFTVLVTSIAAVYTEFIDAQRKSISVQRRLESLQNVSNSVSKTARTSVLRFPITQNATNTTNQVVLFDRTRPVGNANCVKFEFVPAVGTNPAYLAVASANAADEASCSSTSSFSPLISITDSQYSVTGSFYYRIPSSTSVGFLAISIQGCDPMDGSTCNASDAYSSATKVQSAASMRP